MPLTRARTSTSREPAVWPVYSNDASTALGCTVTVLTAAGGLPPPGPPCAAVLPLELLQAATNTESNAASSDGKRMDGTSAKLRF